MEQQLQQLQQSRRPLLGVWCAVGVIAVLVLLTLFGVGRGGQARAASSTGGPVVPTTEDASRGIVVSATGEVTGVPDVLQANLGVETTAERVDAALRDASAAMAKMRAALHAQGVADKDVQTTAVDVGQNYGKDGPSGYRVSQQVTVKIHDVGKAGAVLDAATKAGGNAARINGVSFDVTDDEALITQARKNAFAAAKAKAQTYADVAERSLGAVMSVSETVDANAATPYPMARASGAASSSDMQIAPGTQQLSVTVTVRWAFS